MIRKLFCVLMFTAVIALSILPASMQLSAAAKIINCESVSKTEAAAIIAADGTEAGVTVRVMAITSEVFISCIVFGWVLGNVCAYQKYKEIVKENQVPESPYVYPVNEKSQCIVTLEEDKLINVNVEESYESDD